MLWANYFDKHPKAFDTMDEPLVKTACAQGCLFVRKVRQGGLSARMWTALMDEVHGKEPSRRRGRSSSADSHRSVSPAPPKRRRVTIGDEHLPLGPA